MRNYTFEVKAPNTSWTSELEANMDSDCWESYGARFDFGPFAMVVNIFTEGGEEWQGNAYYQIPNVIHEIDIVDINGKESFEEAKDSVERALEHRIRFAASKNFGR